MHIKGILELSSSMSAMRVSLALAGEVLGKGDTKTHQAHSSAEGGGCGRGHLGCPEFASLTSMLCASCRWV